ncbi:MAG: hypothetical protein IB618_01445 [Candidatus Pacearchaeota archaeon]|nr:MAG: hypothetical protein IB618_01445 [Candidatus Pacearchaeota archaeon]
MKPKFMLFLFGLIVLVVSLIGLAFNFGYTPGVIAQFPADPRVYFGITAIVGLIALISALTSRRF